MLCRVQDEAWVSRETSILTFLTSLSPNTILTHESKHVRSSQERSLPIAHSSHNLCFDTVRPRVDLLAVYLRQEYVQGYHPMAAHGQAPIF